MYKYFKDLFKKESNGERAGAIRQKALRLHYTESRRNHNGRHARATHPNRLSLEVCVKRQM